MREAWSWLVRVLREREGGAVLCSFIDWFLLLVARCLLGVSLVSRVRALHIFISLACNLEFVASLCRCERLGLNWRR